MSPTPWILVVLAALAPIPSASAADDVAVGGTVVDAASGAPLAGVAVRAGGSRAATDAQGAFELRMPRGAATLEFSAPGYLGQSRQLEVGDEPPPRLEVALVPRPRFQEELQVEDAGARAEGTSVLPVRPSQVLSVAGGLDNVFRVAQTLPGVAGTDEFGSRLSVRGGSPDENLTVMDGVEIHNPYRLFGLTSAFNPETVERFEFTAGGFGARHGDRLSSLLIVENREGSRSRGLAGSSSLSITDGNVIFEGKLPGAAAGSWLLTTRRTYYDLVAERFTGSQLPAFQDVQFKAAWEPGPGRKLTLTGLRSREDSNVVGGDGDEEGRFLSNVHNDLLSAAFHAGVGAGTSRTVLSWYRDSSDVTADALFRTESHRSNGTGGGALPLTSLQLDWRHRVRDLSLRQELSLPWGPGRLLEAGLELHRLQSRVTFRLEGLRSILQQDGPDGLPTGLDGRAPAHTRGGIWVQDRLQWGEALVVTPGVRLDWSGLARHPTLSPRLGATYALGTFTRLRAALGLYTQSPGYEKLVQSDYVVDQVDLRFERARHAILGLEHDLAPGVTARVEVYHKRFRDLILGRLETEAELADRLRRYDFPEALQGDIPREPRLTSVPTNDGRGHAYGFDLYLSRTGGAASRLTGWASYTFGVARREGYGLVYPFEYDRRHSLSLVGQYRVGPRVSFAATARVASGFPWTPPAGVRVAGEELPDGRIVPERDGRRRLVYEVAPGGRAALNSERLPAFARLDLRAAFRPRGVAGRWEFFAEVINALDRDNVSGFRSTLALDPESDRPSLVLERVGSIPLIPSFGVRFQFD